MINNFPLMDVTDKLPRIGVINPVIIKSSANGYDKPLGV
jgi:hypothetical protein